jgi:hypothetical protein
MPPPRPPLPSPEGLHKGIEPSPSR